MVNRIYDEGAVAHAQDPNTPNPYKEGTKRSLWWNRGWLDAELTAEEDFIPPNEHPRRHGGYKSQHTYMERKL